MKFIETRGNDGVKKQEVTFSEAILSPISSFGGLYCPKMLPQLGNEFFQKHIKSTYKELAFDLLNIFDVDIDTNTIKEALDLYDKFDDPDNPVPVVHVKDKLYVSELYHGPTRAFKDMALQPFGYVLSSIAQAKNDTYLILAATSGDTGPAALETFKDRDNIKVACLYPSGGTSDVQRLQMVTEDASNLKVIGINGVFDDAQNALKRLLASNKFDLALKEKHISLSAANSVNFGRIIFQIIYHIYSYLELVRQNVIKMGDNVYLDVPSGNFGNALGGYYAMKMGLFVEKIIIASNENNVLTKLIKDGKYDLRDSHVISTTSPAMDILKSSNVERVLFDLLGDTRTKELMDSLDKNLYYELTSNELELLQKFFDADFCTEEENIRYIKDIFDNYKYLMDPHTATCFKAYDSCVNKQLATIAYSTAEWTKFSPTIAKALANQDNLSDKEALELISKISNKPIPEVIKELFIKPVVQTDIIDKEKIEEGILGFLS